MNEINPPNEIKNKPFPSNSKYSLPQEVAETAQKISILRDFNESPITTASIDSETSARENPLGVEIKEGTLFFSLKKFPDFKVSLEELWGLDFLRKDSLEIIEEGGIFFVRREGDPSSKISLESLWNLHIHSLYLKKISSIGKEASQTKISKLSRYCLKTLRSTFASISKGLSAYKIVPIDLKARK